MSKTVAYVLRLINSLALNDHMIEYNRWPTKKKVVFLELDTKHAIYWLKLIDCKSSSIVEKLIKKKSQSK